MDELINSGYFYARSEKPELKYISLMAQRSFNLAGFWFKSEVEGCVKIFVMDPLNKMMTRNF